MGKNMASTLRSWKTSLAGIVTAVILALTQVGAVLDDDPETKPDTEVFFMALGALGLGVFARDGDKSSEQVGAK